MASKKDTITMTNVLDGEKTYSATMAELGTDVEANPEGTATADLEKVSIDESIYSIGANKANLVNGKVPASELPSYVDDVEEYEDVAHFPATGEEGKIYVAVDTGFTYRWSGSQYIQIGGSSIIVDSTLSSTSENPVQNKVIYNALGNKQDVIDTTHKLSADYVDDSATTNKFVTSAEKSTWNDKQNALTTSSVNDGTINKSIGFDSQGNIVKDTISSGMSNPMTAQGDVIVGGNDGTPTRLAKGSAGQILAMNSAGTLPEWNTLPAELFWCTYETTTYADITSALSAGKLPVIYYNSKIFVYAYYENSRYYFNCAQSTYYEVLYVRNNNVWNRNSAQYQTANNKTTSLSSSSTDTQYPSAKCVYDALALKQNTLTASTGIDITSNVIKAVGVEILTTAPTADNTDGLKFVVLSSDPATKYNGYLYVITGSN